MKGSNSRPVTRAELKKFAAKEDLKCFATALTREIVKLSDRIEATKDDINRIMTFLDGFAGRIEASVNKRLEVKVFGSSSPPAEAEII